MNAGSNFKSAAAKNWFRRNKNTLIFALMLFLMFLAGLVNNDKARLIILACLFGLFCFSVANTHKQLCETRTEHEERMRQLENKLTGKQK